MDTDRQTDRQTDGMQRVYYGMVP